MSFCDFVSCACNADTTQRVRTNFVTPTSKLDRENMNALSHFGARFSWNTMTSNRIKRKHKYIECKSFWCENKLEDSGQV